jgi:hypothetical protein
MSGWEFGIDTHPQACRQLCASSSVSRAVSWHAAGVGISGAASLTIASFVGNWAGTSASLLLGGATALSAVLIAATVMPSALAVQTAKAAACRLLDFWPVLRNRAAMAGSSARSRGFT